MHCPCCLFCLAFITPVAVYEPRLSDLLLSINKAAIGSNYTASSLQKTSPPQIQRLYFGYPAQPWTPYTNSYIFAREACLLRSMSTSSVSCLIRYRCTTNFCSKTSGLCLVVCWLLIYCGCRGEGMRHRTFNQDGGRTRRHAQDGGGNNTPSEARVCSRHAYRARVCSRHACEPGSAHVVPAKPGSALVVPAKPGSVLVVPAMPESPAKMATMPADAPLWPGLIASVLDPPLVSVRAAGIPRSAESAPEAAPSQELAESAPQPLLVPSGSPEPLLAPFGSPSSPLVLPSSPSPLVPSSLAFPERPRDSAPPEHPLEVVVFPKEIVLGGPPAY